MSIVNVSLGDSDDQAAIFYNLRYQCDHEGGNNTETVFEITNLSGNWVTVQTALYATDERTQKTALMWETPLPQNDGVRLTFRGSAENAEFLAMLKLILEAEKMVGIIKP